MDIILKRSQIAQIIKIYEHFHEIEDFTITIGDDGTATIKFEITAMNGKIDKTFIPTYK